MSQLHRLSWIDAEIRRGACPNCRTIAERFEISRRQASRDVEYLRYSMGAPVEYSPEKNGYFYTEETFILPAYILSDSEKDTLGYLAFRYGRMGSEQGRRLAELLKRMGGREELAEDFPGLGAPKLAESEASVFAALKKAAFTQREVKILYRDAAGEESSRTIHPYKIFTNGGNSYVAGYCELRKELRIFRLARILGVRETEEDFVRVTDFRDADYGEETPFSFREPHIAELTFECTDRLEPTGIKAERIGPKTFRFQFQRSEEMIRFLLARGEEFTILSPEWLKSKLRERLRKLEDRNA